MSSGEAALPFRVYGLEGQVSTLDEAVERNRTSLLLHDAAIGRQAITLAEHEQKLMTADERIEVVAASVTKLASTVDKGIWALLSFAFTVAAAAVTVAIS